MLKIKDYTVPQPEPGKDNRDAGKTFRITEMPAEPAEWWSIRAMQGLVDSGVNLPAEVVTSGIAGLSAFNQLEPKLKAQIGYALIQALAGVERGLLKELLDEMFTRISFVSSSGKERKLFPNDIEEVSTRLALRVEFLDLQIGFTLAASPSTSGSAAAVPNQIS